MSGWRLVVIDPDGREYHGARFSAVWNDQFGTLHTAVGGDDFPGCSTEEGADVAVTIGDPVLLARVAAMDDDD